MTARARCVADDDELPRLPVLGARRERRGAEDGGDVVVAHRRIREGPVRALAADDIEEVVTHSRTPTRANVFTYMMRSCGWNAHRFHASECRSPMRCSTNGVIDRYEASGSSVSIS